jgi:hypothetical protein
LVRRLFYIPMGKSRPIRRKQTKSRNMMSIIMMMLFSAHLPTIKLAGIVLPRNFA